MIEDRELDIWREQWSRIAGPSPRFQREIQQKIRRQNLRFLVGNVVTAIGFVGMLIFAVVLRRQASWLGAWWATGISALALVSAGYRFWILRGTWHPETQSTRAFLELWHRRVQARLRLLEISVYVSLGWIVFCAVLTAVNWRTIGRDVKAHPRDWLEVLVACLLMQPVLWFGAAWIRRRKLAELNEVKKALDELDQGLGTSVP